jgi:hypothetical protein
LKKTKEVLGWENLMKEEKSTCLFSSLRCIICEKNEAGYCKEINKAVPKLKMSAVDWPMP